MSGTTKAILSMCVLLLAALVIYYGMTPPVTDSLLQKQSQTTYSNSPLSESPIKRFTELGIPPTAASLTPNASSVTTNPESVREGQPITTDDPDQKRTIIPSNVDPQDHALSGEPEHQVRTYIVKVGETLGEIASNELGSFHLWRELASFNGINDPNRIRVGMILRLPPSISSISSTPSEPLATSLQDIGTTVHIVVSGDTLSSIAGAYYGDVNQFRKIANANPSIDPNNITVGERLIIPQQ